MPALRHQVAAQAVVLVVAASPEVVEAEVAVVAGSQHRLRFVHFMI